VARLAVIAVVPARRGSKSIAGKNSRPIAGRPLAGWAIAAALGAELVERTVVATDDPQVATLARGMGAEVHERSAASASDTAPTEAVLAEVLEATAGEHFVLLQPTSPLTAAADVDAAIGLYRDGGYDSVLSVAPQTRFVWTEDGDGAAAAWNYDPRARPRRQEAEPILVENGALYVFSAELLRREGARLGGRVGLYRMGPETYHELDEPEDWGLVAGLLARRQRRAAGWDGIELVLSDVDGVLTDNGMYWSSDGAELKRFSARDGKGFELLHAAGVKTALITSEALELVTRRGEKLGCHRVEVGCGDKLAAAERLRAELALEWEQVAFLGDDLHDIALLERVGASFAPADAVPAVREVVDRVLDLDGGRGCFRELADLLLEGRRGGAGAKAYGGG
jgi:YrbI family 3-deoxy-D-manno-octulosonate 8-phosphate phosphatase